MDASAIVPYLRAPHGWMVFCEDSNGPIIHEKKNIIVVRGMIHGSFDEMKRQVEYVFSKVDTLAICIVEANYPSFRFPDSTMRRLFRHVEKYRAKIDKIFMVRLPFLPRMGFHMATKLMSVELNQLLDIQNPPPVHPQITRTWIEDYIRLCATRENFTVTDDTIEFDNYYLEKSKQALIQAEPIVKTYSGFKKGSGGWLGSSRWKRKTFVITSTEFVYSDSKDTTRIPFSTIRSIVKSEADIVTITDEVRDFVLKLDRDADELVTIISQAQ